jgi:pimeloyl-ACP methyl ester carboxylesterase
MLLAHLSSLARRFRLPLVAVAVLCCALPSAGVGQEPVPATTAEPVVERSLPNVATGTLGGTQFWSDELVYRDWRIQRNVVSGHYRLLDDRDFRRAWGTFEQCAARLEELKSELELPPMDGKAVVLLHGIIRSRSVMEDMAEYLDESGDFTAINVSYASTRRTLDEHAASLARVIDNLEGIDEIHFVCHSLGNLVLRRYLGEATAESPQWRVDPRIKRIVMLAPPNQGAKLAEAFKNNKLVGLIWGPCCKQLANDWQSLETRLAIPKQQFGIIAGGRGDEEGANPLVEGDDDLVLSIDETRLPGASDFLVVNRLHGQLLGDEDVQKNVLRFLENGYFVSEADRQPIPMRERVEAAEAIGR